MQYEYDTQASRYISTEKYLFKEKKDTAINNQKQ